jgi:phosphate transport system substrate-binding protein
MIKKLILRFLSVATLSVFILTGCGVQGNDFDDHSGRKGRFLNIQGSDTMVNLGQALAEVYMDDVKPEASIAVTGGGSGTGIAALLNNNVDIAQSSRRIKQEELDEANEKGIDVYEFIVAQDGLAVVVNSANPIEKLTIRQIKDIFTGKISNWGELGWEEGGDIARYSRQSNSGTYVFFNENVMDGEDWAEGTMFMPGSAAIAEGILNDGSGIGYFGIGYVKEDGNKALEVAFTEGDAYITPMLKENVDSGKYPITRPLFFYSNGVPQGEALAYLNWVLGGEGQNVIGESGFYSYTSEQKTKNDEILKNLGL